MTILYTATAASTGQGRDGHVSTPDGLLDTDVRVPKEMGGPGGATNPEQLFAAGYAACFHSAIKHVASQDGRDAGDSEVVADVSVLPAQGGFGLAVQLEVALPNLDEVTARDTVEKAHQICPYSNATRGNVEVTITLA